MEHSENATAPKRLFPHTAETGASQPDKSGGNAYLYILIVMSFYGVFLCGVMLGYFRSKRQEKRRSNVFTRLVHEEEEREWGALPKKNSVAFPAAVSGLRAVQASLPFCGNHGNHPGLYEGALLPSPLSCALCTEQSSISSLCSSADARFAIEEERSDIGTEENPKRAEENPKGPEENSADDSG